MGLTGGIGSGKSTAAKLLADRGAVVIDADAIAREVVEKGTPGFAAVIERFGDAVVGSDGALDRPALAAIVFTDDAQLADLNAIVHPLVGQRVAELEAAAPPSAVLVYDVPLLVESAMADGFDFVVVVEAPVEMRLQRLAGRGMAEQDAHDRMAAQAGDDDRRAVADDVIVNDGTLDDLTNAVDRVWARLQSGGRNGPHAV